MSKNIRKRRDKLWLEKEHKCYWCGCETVLPPRGNSRAMPSPNFATLDHLRTRLDLNRTEPNISNEERTVLSCWKCNNARGVLDQKATQELLVKVKASQFRLPDKHDDKML